MRLVRGLLALALACLGQMLLSRYLPGLARLCDLFTIVVVYYGLAHAPSAAVLMGTGAGLVQDALVGTILGLNGFKKTLLGYVVGTVGSLFMLNQPIPRFGILFLATLLDPLAEFVLLLSMGQGFAPQAALELVERGLGNGVVGLFVFWLAARTG